MLMTRREPVGALDPAVPLHPGSDRLLEVAARGRDKVAHRAGAPFRVIYIAVTMCRPVSPSPA